MQRTGPYSKKSYLSDMVMLLGVALIFFGFGIREYRQQYLLSTRGITAEIHFIGTYRISKYLLMKPRYYADITFTTAQGQKVMLYNRPISTADIQAFRAGQPVIHQYLPNNVQIIRPFKPDFYWDNCFPVLIGIVSLFTAVILSREYRQQKER